MNCKDAECKEEIYADLLQITLSFVGFALTSLDLDIRDLLKVVRILLHLCFVRFLRGSGVYTMFYQKKMI